jgi:hypothetical protein
MLEFALSREGTAYIFYPEGKLQSFLPKENVATCSIYSGEELIADSISIESCSLFFQKKVLQPVQSREEGAACSIERGSCGLFFQRKIFVAICSS